MARGTEGYVSEHPPQSILLGQKKIAQVTNALIKSSIWTSSALFFTYDEGDGLPSAAMFKSYIVHRHNTGANCGANVPEYLYSDDTLDIDA